MSGADGVPREWLAGSPFADYFVPSLFLFTVVGGALALGAVMVSVSHRWARLAAITGGVIVLAWISVQVAIIGFVSWMQPATFTAGVLVVCDNSAHRRYAAAR
jgi:hypothetical protein